MKRAGCFCVIMYVLYSAVGRQLGVLCGHLCVLCSAVVSVFLYDNICVFYSAVGRDLAVSL